jgi:hypothetical protein
VSEDLGTEPISEKYDGPDPTEQAPKPGSEQVVGDDESDYGGAGADDGPGEAGAERGPREEDEDQGV